VCWCVACSLTSDQECSVRPALPGHVCLLALTRAPLLWLLRCLPSRGPAVDCALCADVAIRISGSASCMQSVTPRAASALVLLCGLLCPVPQLCLPPHLLGRGHQGRLAEEVQDEVPCRRYATGILPLRSQPIRRLTGTPCNQVHYRLLKFLRNMFIRIMSQTGIQSSPCSSSLVSSRAVLQACGMVPHGEPGLRRAAQGGPGGGARKARVGQVRRQRLRISM